MATETTDATLTRGHLESIEGDKIVVSLPGTDYRIHLAVESPPSMSIGKPISGRIVAQARRIDALRGGGRFIEPVYGRPRRLQGTVVATDDPTGTIAVECAAGCTFVCTPMAPQRPRDFAVGQLVSLDVERGARFEPMERE